MGTSGLEAQQLTTPRYLRQYATEGAGLSPHITQIVRAWRDSRPTMIECPKANPPIAHVSRIRLDAAPGNPEGVAQSILRAAISVGRIRSASGEGRQISLTRQVFENKD
jgi:hypothetical protein